jgi:hypothetical protein
MTKAVIFVPVGEFDPHAARCAEYVEEKGYELAGVVRGDWAAVQKMMRDGEADVVVLSTEDHLDPRRKPRIEVVANAALSRWETRTRVIRRGGAR